MAVFDGVTPAALEKALEGLATSNHTHNHGSLTGLTNDDHPQYLNTTRGDARYPTKAEFEAALAGKADSNYSPALADLSDVGEQVPSDGQSLVWSAALGEWRPALLAEGGVVDHGALIGLGDDDHPQYLNNARGDARYYVRAHIDTNFYTRSQVDAAIAGHDHTLAGLSDVGEQAPGDGQALVWHQTAGEWRPATIQAGGGVTDHGALTGLGDDDHPQYLNTARGDARYYTKAEVDAAVASGQVSRVVVSADHQAVNGQIVAVDTDAAAGAVTVTAPAASQGAYFYVGDTGGNASLKSIFVDFAGASFDGAAQSFEIDVNTFGTGFLFNAGEWELFRG